MATYHRPRAGAILLAALFAFGTAYVLLEDVIRHGAEITTAHIQTILALIGTIAAGHLFIPEIRARRYLPALGCALLFLGGTAYIVTASGARNALIAHDKAAAAQARNDERAAWQGKVADAEADVEAARAEYDEAKRQAAKECGTGKAKRCDGRIETREAAAKDLEKAESHAALMRGRLALLKPEADTSAGYAHAGRVFAALPFVTASAADITDRLTLLMPFVLVVLLEIGTLTFASRAISPAPAAKPAARDTAQTSFPANDLGSVEDWVGPPQPPRPGTRAKPQADRERMVRDFVTAYRTRHGHDPAPREVRQATGLPRASAHRWQRRVG